MSYYLHFNNITLATMDGLNEEKYGSKKVGQVGSNLSCVEKKGCLPCPKVTARKMEQIRGFSVYLGAGVYSIC